MTTFIALPTEKPNWVRPASIERIQVKHERKWGETTVYYPVSNLFRVCFGLALKPPKKEWLGTFEPCARVFFRDGGDLTIECETDEAADELAADILALAQGIEARSAETALAGSVGDESPVPGGDAPNPDGGHERGRSDT
jgi:hypothetical protein